MLSSMDSETLTEVMQPIGDASLRHRACAEFRAECTGRSGGRGSAVPDVDAHASYCGWCQADAASCAKG
jgi:hypothetical protein